MPLERARRAVGVVQPLEHGLSFFAVGVAARVVARKRDARVSRGEPEAEVLVAVWARWRVHVSGSKVQRIRDSLRAPDSRVALPCRGRN